MTLNTNWMMLLLSVMCLLVPGPAIFAESTQIRAGSTIDPLSGDVLRDQLLTINDGKIELIEAFRESLVQDGLIDLSHSWLMPGLIDTHVHITWNLGEFGSPEVDRVNIKESSALRALRGAKVAGEFLHAGFTTIKEVGNDANYATADIIEAVKQGWFPGPDIQYAGKIIAPYGGQMAGASFRNRGYWDFEYIDADTRDEMLKAIRQNIYFGADAIKLVVDKYSYYYSSEDVRFIVEEAARSKLKVTAHAMGGEPARQVILGGAAGIDHGFDLDEELLKLMKKKGTFLIGTDFAFENFRAYGDSEELARENENKMVERLRLAHEVGVKLAYGTDIVINLPEKNRVESSFEVLEVWKKAGIPPMVLLVAMTSNAAELMGLDDSRGQLKPGFRADLVAMSADPLAAIDNVKSVHFVMKQGEVFRQD